MRRPSTIRGKAYWHLVIGRGGIGAAYRAVDERLGRSVAASLHHPNVITVYDFGTDPELGLDFLVMELLHGEDLANRMAHSGPPPLSTRRTAPREAGRGSSGWADSR